MILNVLTHVKKKKYDQLEVLLLHLEATAAQAGNANILLTQ